jgi:Protein of unknown function, DUF481
MRILAAFIAVCALAGVARAEDPKFEYGKREEVKDPNAAEWKAQAQAGLVLTTGNSHTSTFSAGANASRKQGDNKLSLEAAGAYGKSELRIASDLNGDGLLGPDEIFVANQQTTNSYLVKARYDRFLTLADSLFVTARIGADKIAGKTLIAGGQIGYSRLLLKTADHELATEIGYDYTFENYAADNVDSLSIHSARLYAGYLGKLSADSSVGASVEWLTNLNSEDTAPNDRDGDGNAGDDTPGVDPLADNRLTGKISLTTKLRTNISFRASFTARLDSAPAPLPNVKGSMGYEPGFQPVAEELDTITEAQLIIDLL